MHAQRQSKDLDSIKHLQSQEEPRQSRSRPHSGHLRS